MLEVGMDEGSQLHRNGASPTSGATGKEGFAVDATMAVEAPVLGGDHSGLERGRDVRERCPGESPPRRIDACFMDDLAIAVQQAYVRRAVCLSHLLEGGQSTSRISQRP